MQTGNKMTREAMRRAKQAERTNYAKTLGSGDQRRNHADVRKFKRNPGY